MNQAAIQLLQEDCARVAQDHLALLEPLADASILVTGGSGFMGGWIAEMICHLNEVHRKEIRLSIQARDRERFQQRLPHIEAKRYVTFLRGDVRDTVDIPREVRYVIHAAGTPDNRVHTSSPMETMSVIGEGTRALLQAAERAAELRMFLNVSSGNVYGSQPPDLARIPESYSGSPRCGAVESAYAEAKRYAETLVTAARSQARLPVATVRPFSFVGAYQPLDAPWAANNFMNDGLHKRPIRVFGDGQTVRSIMYGADMALWLLVILASTKTGQTYNLGSGTGVTLESLARRVAAQLQPVPEVVLNSSRSGHIPNSVLVPDVAAAETDFGLRNTTDVDTAIQRTLKWYQSC